MDNFKITFGQNMVDFTLNAIKGTLLDVLTEYANNPVYGPDQSLIDYAGYKEAWLSYAIDQAHLEAMFASQPLELNRKSESLIDDYTHKITGFTIEYEFKDHSVMNMDYEFPEVHELLKDKDIIKLFDALEQTYSEPEIEDINKEQNYEMEL